MPEPRAEKIHLFADFTLDLARGCLLSGDRLVHLRPQAYEVLRYLAENRGKLICKDKLIETVWQRRAVTDDALVQCLIEVRNALGQEGKLYVRNVRGRGYIFDPDVGQNGTSMQSRPEPNDSNGSLRPNTRSGQATSGEVNHEKMQVSNFLRSGQHLQSEPNGISEVRTPERATTLVSSVERHKLAALLVSAFVIFGVAAVVYYKYSISHSAGIASIAVLPFSNATGDQNLEYFSDGLSETLIDRLSQLPGVKVISRSSSFKYKGKEADPAEVAASLGVEAVVMGKVVRRGADLQVKVDFVNAREGTQIWGAQYSRPAGDVQAVQEEIARAISEKLSLRLSGEQTQQLTKHATQNSQAYQLYLGGLFYRRQGGLQNARKALDYYSQALALDQNFALAWTGVAEVHFYFANDGFANQKDALATAQVAAEKALTLDDSLAEAHLVQAELKKAQWQWSEADREFKRAIQLNPNSVEAHHWYARYLSPMGRHTEALAEYRRAQELDPLRMSLRSAEAIALCLAGRCDEAVERLQQAIQIEPGSGGRHISLGIVYQAKGMYNEAIDQFERALELGQEMTFRQIALGYSLAMSGKRSEAQAILERLKVSKNYVSPAELAILYVGLGDKHNAIASLEKAYADRDLQLQYLKVVPEYDPLRSDPRFQELVRRVGLDL
jgi:TolB-like protein/DNA-binding winged helix-turn-helix (wHTH) protein/lipoprotein NlpI